MILDRSQALVGRISDLRRLREQSRRLRDFRDVSQALARAVGKLSPILPMVELFARRGIGQVNVAKDAAVLLPRVRAAMELAASEPDQLTNRDRLDVNNLERTIEDLTRQLDAQLTVKWSKFADERVPALDTGVLSTLSNLPPLRDWANRVRAAQSQVQELRQRRPRNDADVDAFLAAAAKLRSTNDEFGADLPESLLAFIRAAAGKGFTLTNFTSELAAEIRRRNWERYFVLSVSAAGA